MGDALFGPLGPLSAVLAIRSELPKFTMPALLGLVTGCHGNTLTALLGHTVHIHMGLSSLIYITCHFYFNPFTRHWSICDAHVVWGLK
jgi:hypothetical protein